MDQPGCVDTVSLTLAVVKLALFGERGQSMMLDAKMAPLTCTKDACNNEAFETECLGR